MQTALTVRAATADDRRYIESLLSGCDLPTADLSTPQLYVCTVDGQRIGTGGIEQYGAVGLLRSVAIEDEARGHGYGVALVDTLCDRAQQAGVAELHLLTTTASEFFRNRGFTERDRDTVPEPIRETEQFQNICPDTATCLSRSLEQ